MHLPTPVLHVLDAVLTHPVTAQVAPLAVVVGLPALALFLAGPALALARMVFSFWPFGPSAPAPPREERKLRKKGMRRAGQPPQNGQAGGQAIPPEKVGAMALSGYYPGLVNISGTYCFMDSTLQALASLSYLPAYLDTIQTRAEILNVPTPAVDALRALLLDLNTPRSQKLALRPHGIVDALAAAEARHRRNAMMHSRQHQDAQELFQLLAEQLKAEAGAVRREARRDRGFALPPSVYGDLAAEDAQLRRSVFDGLTANRRACVRCGYTEAVMHFGFDSWTLALPAGACALEDCLAEYTRLELLTDCVCRRCALRATHARLAADANRATATAEAEPNPSSSKKRRARDARKYEARVRAMLDEGRIEDELGDIRLERVVEPATKQAMVARPPPVLALHLNRSHFGGAHASKNRAPVAFPPVLDLAPFTTSGELSTAPRAPLSGGPAPAPFFMAPRARKAGAPDVLYSLASVVCHYGDHAFGHYVAYRRAPRAPPDPAAPTPSAHALNEEEWLRASDHDVRRVGLSAVLAEQSAAFMLFYERVPPPPGAPREASVVSGAEAWPARTDGGSSVLSREYGGDLSREYGSELGRGSAETVRMPSDLSSAPFHRGDPTASVVDTTARTGLRTSARPTTAGFSDFSADGDGDSMFGTGVATGAHTSVIYSDAGEIPPGAVPSRATAGSGLSSRASTPPLPVPPPRSSHVPTSPGARHGSLMPDARHSSPSPTPAARLVRSVTARRIGLSNAAINAGAFFPPAPLAPTKGPAPPLVMAPTLQRDRSPVPSAYMRRRPAPE